MIKIAQLPQRGVLKISGPDRVGFLNGLVSNEVSKAGPGQAVWAALLTPQGKYLADFFILATDEALLLDVRAADMDMLLAKFRRFKLRAAVELADASGQFAVYAGWGGAPLTGLAAPDPRLAEAGWRGLSAGQILPTASPQDYAAHRISLGLPDGPPDLEPEKTLLLEAGFDELHGVAWDKGCYMGQELTARTKYRGLVKRRLVPVELDHLPQEAGTIMADGLEVGDLRSVQGNMGLAMLRLDALARRLSLNGAAITPRPPAWLRLPPIDPAVTGPPITG